MADYIDDDNLWKEDLFATLGVTQEASDGELKKAYLKLAKKYHPDKFVEENDAKLEAQRLFSKITVAYNTLIEPQKRKHYLELRRLLASHLPENQNAAPIFEVKKEDTPPTPQTASTPTTSHTPPPQREMPSHSSTDKVKEEQAMSFHNLGLEAMKRKKYDDAIDYFKKAIATKSDVAEFHSQLGLAYKNKNWEGMAQSEFKLALKYNPSDKIAKTNATGGGNAKDGEKKSGGLFSSLFNFGKKK